jgi:hypothetical protein
MDSEQSRCAECLKPFEENQTVITQYLSGVMLCVSCWIVINIVDPVSGIPKGVSNTWESVINNYTLELDNLFKDLGPFKSNNMSESSGGED